MQLAADAIFLSVYGLILLVIAVYGLHRYWLVWLYARHRNVTHTPSRPFQTVPYVTVQLPMFNEHEVAVRIIESTCKIAWPADRFEIQVLDDSTDAKDAALARETCDRLNALGHNVVYLHRTNRVGYKAGALAEGLKSAKGEFIAIFDADFIPPTDILHNTVPHFIDEKIGCVQVRWEHLNREASMLTRGQAIFLDGHFVIEHTARNRSGAFMHFNGTAGVWRRTCIDEGGGWQHDTLTEDLDLSYRCQIKGWQFLFLPQFFAPAELPPEILAFKQQAHRWTKGSMQTCLKLLPGILRSKTLPRHVKTEAFFHLTCTVAYPLMVLLTIMIWPAFIAAEGPLKEHPLAAWVFGGSFFVIATCSAGTFFCYAQRELYGRGAGLRSIRHLPYLMMLGVGISLNNTRAVGEAIFDKRQSRNEFIRTPKYGVQGRQKQKTASGVKLNSSKLLLPIIEILFGLYMSCFIFVSIAYQFALASLPFLMMFAAGYFYVGFNSLWVMFKMHREALEAEAIEIAAA